jgi:hypothetical protein
MAVVKVECITPGQFIGQKVVICIDVQTTVGNCMFPFSVDDQGSNLANEQQARRELQVFLQEALQAMEDS